MSLARRTLARGRFIRAAGLVLFGVIGVGFSAAPAPGAGAIRVRLVARNEPVRDVLLHVGALAHLNIAIADDVTGTVSVSLHDATAAEALHAICPQLRLRCVNDGRTVVVTAPASVVMPLVVVPAARAARVVSRLFPSLAVTEGGFGNTLVLAGSEADIASARAVVQALDVRDPTKPTTQALAVHSQPASAVAERLRALYPNARISVVAHNTMLVSATPADFAQIGAVVQGIDGAVPLPSIAPVASDAVRITQRRPRDVARAVADQIRSVRAAVSGSTVTLSGSPDDVARAKTLIAQLDVPPFGALYTQIYRLKNVDAASVGTLVTRAFANATVSVDSSLNALSVTATAGDQQRIAEGVSSLDGTGPSGLNGAAGEEGAGPGAPPSGQEVVQLRSIVPGSAGSAPQTSAQDIASALQLAFQTTHPDLHATVPNGMEALILTGNAQSIRDAKTLIAQLDVVPQSVVLDTEILELDESSSRNLGIQLGTTSIGTTYTEVTPPANPDGSAARIGRLQALTRTPLSFQAQINLLIQNGKARVLADPRITTLSGRTASIRAGDTISIITTVGGGTGTVPSTQLESFQTGVNLDITPLITGAGDLLVELHPVVNSLTGYLNGVPQISTRDTQTQVQLHDNETLVIGGLIEESNQRTESKIPFFGDIPLVGPLFRNENVTDTRNELVLVVTPHLLGTQLPGGPPPGPPGMLVPAPNALPTLPPNAVFPAPPPTLAPSPAPSPLASKGAKTAASPAPSASGSAPAAVPSAFAQANSYVYGAAPTSTYAGPNDAPQIFYAMLTPTVVTPSSTVHVSVITTTNVQKLTIGTGSATVALTSVGQGTWQGTFSVGVLGSANTSSLRLALTAARSDGQSATIAININVVHGGSNEPVL